jgi:hypothetical protein
VPAVDQVFQQGRDGVAAPQQGVPVEHGRPCRIDGLRQRQQLRMARAGRDDVFPSSTMRASGTVPPGASISLQKYVNVARSCANSSTVRPSATMVERCGAVDVLEQQQQVDVGRAWAGPWRTSRR